MPIRLCSDHSQGHGCPNPATYRGRCAEHARTTNRTTHRNRRIYNSKRWRILRERVLFEEPLCRCGCDGISTDVDHIVAIEAGGDPWARANLQALTHEHHARKTRQEQATQ